QLSGVAQPLALPRFIDDCEHQFNLLRPEVELQVTLADDAATRIIKAVPSLRHALINLLSNGADASLASGRPLVELHVTVLGDLVEFGVRDHGGGIAPGGGAAFQTSKRDGLGLGLALAHATAERLGGELTAHAPADGGLLQRLRVPLAADDNAA